MKPLFFNFPEDEEVYKDEIMNEQYMLGTELMVTPIVYQNQKLRQAYFPGNWYEYNLLKQYNFA